MPGDACSQPRLHDVDVGRLHCGEPVPLLVANEAGRILADDAPPTTLELSRDYQPSGGLPGMPNSGSPEADQRGDPESHSREPRFGPDV